MSNSAVTSTWSLWSTVHHLRLRPSGSARPRQPCRSAGSVYGSVSDDAWRLSRDARMSVIGCSHSRVDRTRGPLRLTHTLRMTLAPGRPPRARGRDRVDGHDVLEVERPPIHKRQIAFECAQRVQQHPSRRNNRLVLCTQMLGGAIL